MSILTPTSNTVQPPSREQLLSRKADRIRDFSRRSFQQLSEIQREGIRFLWEDRGFTPQEIIDTLGPDALKIFQMHGILTDAINQIAAIDGISPEITLPTNAFEVVDGSIVVSEDPYA